MKSSLSLALLMLVFTGCDDSDKAPKTGVRFKVHADRTDHVTCGLGGGKAGAQWDQVSLRGDGQVRWIHTDGMTARTAQEGFEKTAKLSPEDTAKWLQGVVDVGLFDLETTAVADDQPHTKCQGSIDGRALNTMFPGSPPGELHAKLEELMASTLKADK